MFFEVPQAFFGLIVVPSLFFFFWRGAGRRYEIARVFRQSVSHVRRRGVVKAVLVACAFVVLVVGAAQPSFFVFQGTNEIKGNYLFVVDVSKSMAARATPSSPTQEDRAKEIMRSAIKNVPEACFGIVTFAGLAFPLSSLSCDRAVLEEALRYDVEADRIPIQGSNIVNALGVALERIISPQGIYRNITHIIVFTDGGVQPKDNEYERTLAIFRTLIKQYGIQAIIVGVGSKEGVSIPLFDNEGNFTGTYATTTSGARYYSFLNDTLLRDMAEKLSGAYISEEKDEELIGILRRDLSAQGRQRENPESQDASSIFFAILGVTLLVLFWEKYL